MRSLLPVLTTVYSRAICITTALVVSVVALQAQPYWARDLGSIGNDHVADVQVDSDGSIYVTGEFGGTVQFGAQSYTSAGGIDFFIARLNGNGDVVWFKHGGGTGIDRGLKVAIGPGTVLAFAGEFMGTTTFQSQTLTSAGGTADMFVAVLDKATGALQWIRQGGGNAGTDRASGVSVAANGTVSVAGEFRGTATWETNTLTSMVDPDAGTASADIFVASYSATGALAWIKKGTAKYTDRAIDVVHDNAGNLYVTGQFSDTLTFDQTHTNTLLNASFLVRFDASGNEVWFHRFGGAAFNHVRDLMLAPDGRLLLTGDVQGTMVWTGPPNVNVPSGDPYAYYLLAVSTDGVLLSQATTGSQDPVGVSALSVNGGDLAVIGWFNCRFSDLAAHYGATGLFMATGPEDLFVARHAASGFALQEAQQFGGRSDKVPGGIAHIAPDQVVFTGSFQQSLIFPAVPAFTADVSTGPGGIIGNGASEYCGDPDYGVYKGSASAGLFDGFVARGYVEGRAPYDWWIREGSGCDRSELEPCIRQGTASLVCPDTITSCGPAGLNIYTRYSYSPTASVTYLGPAINYQWNTGAVSPSIAATTTGWYWCTTSTVNGCWQWTDSVYVVVNTQPPPIAISDDVVVNTVTTAPQPIELCDPETHWVWAPNVPSGATAQWLDPLGNVVIGDSVQVDTTGSYTLTITAANGCTRTVTVQVTDNPSPEMPDLGLDLLIGFTQDTDLDDTVSVCPNGIVDYVFTPNWTIAGLPAELPEGLNMTWGLVPAPPNNPGTGEEQNGTLPIGGAGWYVLELHVRVTNSPCLDDTLDFFHTDSIYVELLSDAVVDVALTGPSVVCDGDTITLVANCAGCDSLVWSGTSATLQPPNTLLVTGPGTYTVTGNTTDGECTFSDLASITVIMPTGPTLTVDPTNGILCPGTSATMSTTLTGTSPIWYGPQGPILGQGTSYTTAVPGEYYLSMVVNGCPVTSNNVALEGYGTPYLDVQPTAVLCNPGDVVVVQVMAAPDAQVVWAAPIGGSALSVNITQPGTYSCSVTSCGIVTELTVEVSSNPAAAALLTPGPFVLCEGDSIELEAASGFATYTWLPSLQAGSTLTVSAPGNYSVVVENAGGCGDTSAVVVVDQVIFNGGLVITGDTVCAGDAAQLVAAGQGPVLWYSDPTLISNIGSGPTCSFLPGATTLVYARQEESGCNGDTATALVRVEPRPDVVLIDGPSQLCAGEPLLFTAQAPDSVQLFWSTPQGVQAGADYSLASAGVANSGTYACSAIYNGCASAPAAIVLVVNAPLPLELPEYSEFCEGAQVTLSVPTDFNDIQWSNGSTARTIVVLSSADLLVTANDPNGCPASATAEILAVDCPLEIPNIFTPNGDATNDAWFPSGGFVRADAWIYGRWGNLVFEGDMVRDRWDGTHLRNGEPCPDGVYFFVLELRKADGSGAKHTGHIQLLH